MNISNHVSRDCEFSLGGSICDCFGGRSCWLAEPLLAHVLPVLQGVAARHRALVVLGNEEINKIAILVHTRGKLAGR